MYARSRASGVAAIHPFQLFISRAFMERNSGRTSLATRNPLTRSTRHPSARSLRMHWRGFHMQSNLITQAWLKNATLRKLARSYVPCGRRVIGKAKAIFLLRHTAARMHNTLNLPRKHSVKYAHTICRAKLRQPRSDSKVCENPLPGSLHPSPTYVCMQRR